MDSNRVENTIQENEDMRVLFENLVSYVEEDFDVYQFEQEYRSLIEMIANEYVSQSVEVHVSNGRINATVGGDEVDLNSFRPSLNGLLLTGVDEGLYNVSHEQFVLERVTAQVDLIVKAT